jgi:hypothetical protein
MSHPDEQDALSNSADGAQSVPAPHAQELRLGASPPLAALDGRRVMVRIAIGDDVRLMGGEAEYGEDAELGKVLRVYVSRDPEIVFLIVESVFRGRIAIGGKPDCDYVIHAGPSPSASAAERLTSE